MSVPSLLTELRAIDVHVWSENGRLKVNAAPGSLTTDMREQLKQRKGEILEYLDRPDELSFSQQRLWFLDQIEMVNTTYLMPLAMRIDGELNVAVLERSLNSLVERHESLRTSFPHDKGMPLQQVNEADPFHLPVVEVDQKREQLDVLIDEEMRQGFDLESGPLFRAVLYRLGSDEFVLLILQHHIISDAWSLTLMMRELGTLYSDIVDGRTNEFPKLQVQYRDYTRWLRDWMQGERLSLQLDYWRSYLEGAPHVLDVPIDHPRPSMESHRGANYSFAISREVSDGLGELCRREGITVFMALLAALDILLWRYTGQSDLLVGVPIANRDREELENLIGLFVNTLVMRADMSGDPTVQELLARTRDNCVDSYAHQELPVESLVENLDPTRDLSRNPLFQVMLVLENKSQRPTLNLQGTKVTPIHVDRGATHIDWTMYVEESGFGMTGIVEYATDVFDEATIAQMAAHWHKILEAIVAAPERRISDISLLKKSEEQLLLVDWNQTVQVDYKGTCLNQLLGQQVVRVPESVALICEEKSIRYSELEALSNRYARVFRARGVARGQRVGVCVDRSIDMIAIVLGIIKAGAAYVPLDPSFPEDRLNFMADDAELSLLVSTSNYTNSFGLVREKQLLVDVDIEEITVQPDDALLPSTEQDAGPEDPAYMIYTSGSTGQPKGVVVPHRAVSNFLISMAQVPGLSEDDLLVAVTTLSFDISVLELLLPLTVGATVVIASRDDSSNGQTLKTLIESHGATVMQATPVTWRLLLEAGWDGGIEFKALVGGESLPLDLAQQLLSKDVALWNMYGPTETTVWSTCAQITDVSNGISIGKPIANTSVYILDEQGSVCPIGVPGELHVGGAGVTLGYWRRAELTADRFVADPFVSHSDARLYRTGDKCRWLRDGTLEHLGRLDDQVKVRGYRVELGEIEARISEHPDIRETAVHLWTVGEDDVRIVACCIPEKPGQLATVSLRKHLRVHLPDYMIPQYFIQIEEVPLTPNGKVNRRELPIPESSSTNMAPSEAPTDPVEVAIASIWTELIKPARPIGRYDKFFDMGGHSLLALRAIGQMDEKFEVKFAFRNLFQDSLAEIAAGIGKAGS